MARQYEGTRKLCETLFNDRRLRPKHGLADAEHPTDVTQLSRTRSIVIGTGSRDESDESTSTPKSLKSLIKNVKSEAERNVIAAALEKTGWNRKAAARLLRVSYRTMLYKIEQYKMTLSETQLFHVCGPWVQKRERIGRATERQLDSARQEPALAMLIW